MLISFSRGSIAGADQHFFRHGPCRGLRLLLLGFNRSGFLRVGFQGVKTSGTTPNQPSGLFFPPRKIFGKNPPTTIFPKFVGYKTRVQHSINSSLFQISAFPAVRRVCVCIY